MEFLQMRPQRRVLAELHLAARDRAVKVRPRLYVRHGMLLHLVLKRDVYKLAI